MMVRDVVDNTARTWAVKAASSISAEKTWIVHACIEKHLDVPQEEKYLHSSSALKAVYPINARAKVVALCCSQSYLWPLKRIALRLPVFSTVTGRDHDF